MRKRTAAIIMALTFLLGHYMLAQPALLKGSWITPEQDLIEIRNLGRDSSNVLANKLMQEDYFHLFMLGDTLSFQHIYTSSRTQFKIEYVDRYDLKVVSYDKSSLIVKPVSELSKAYFQNRPLLKLRRKEQVIDTTFVFEKLVYHATQAWFSSTVSLQLDNHKNLYLEIDNGFYGHNKDLATGQYMAVLDDSTYTQCITILQNSSIRTLRFGDIEVKDSPEITLIFYFNGKRKYLKSTFTPRVAKDLLSFITWRLQTYADLKPTDKVYELER
ncbi:hypothetical protein LZG74_02025 [Dyadobacter sp. CY327]|uniref:hypothetical protein n=1 Tax=Dyadobacter sp. CY327 TaxID=2907301 RepID=UPI001F3557BF|nr:hypothetical protein [Dyadobacter sp. CY327]MCE7069061.1 hypothetical protein [Dyadobacter sp. CY327]